MTPLESLERQAEEMLVHLQKTDPRFQPCKVTSFVAVGEEGVQEVERHLAQHPDEDGRHDEAASIFPTTIEA